MAQYQYYSLDLISSQMALTETSFGLEVVLISRASVNFCLSSLTEWDTKPLIASSVLPHTLRSGVIHMQIGDNIRLLLHSFTFWFITVIIELPCFYCAYVWSTDPFVLRIISISLRLYTTLFYLLNCYFLPWDTGAIIWNQTKQTVLFLQKFIAAICI